MPRRANVCLALRQDPEGRGHLLGEFMLRGKDFHFDHERMPERDLDRMSDVAVQIKKYRDNLKTKE